MFSTQINLPEFHRIPSERSSVCVCVCAKLVSISRNEKIYLIWSSTAPSVGPGVLFDQSAVQVLAALEPPVFHVWEYFFVDQILFFLLFAVVVIVVIRLNTKQEK